jgi:hypothetical protein
MPYVKHIEALFALIVTTREAMATNTDERREGIMTVQWRRVAPARVGA